jgi:hypothetical protein
MGIYAAEFNQTATGPNASEVFFQVAGPGTTSGSDGPFFAMRGNNFARFSNAKGAIEHRAGTITSPSGNDGAVLFTSPSSFIDMRTGTNFDSRLRITNAGETLFGTTSDAGDFRVQISGNQYVSGESYFGTTTDAGDYRVQINGDTYANGYIAVDDITGTLLYLASFKTTTGAANTGPSIYFGAHNGLTSIDAGYIDLKKANGTLGNNETYMAFQTRNISTGLGERLRIKGDGETLIGYTADQGAYILQANGSGYFSGSLTTGAPTGGTAQPWKLGTVATVSPTSPNRTIEVEVNGTIYYIHAKTTND